MLFLLFGISICKGFGMGDPVFFFFFLSRITFSCSFWRFLGLGELGSFVFWLFDINCRLHQVLSLTICLTLLSRSDFTFFPLVSLFYFIPCGFSISCRGLFTTNTLLDNRLLGFLSSFRLRTAMRHSLQVSYMYFFLSFV